MQALKQQIKVMNDLFTGECNLNIVQTRRKRLLLSITYKKNHKFVNCYSNIILRAKQKMKTNENLFTLIYSKNPRKICCSYSNIIKARHKTIGHPFTFLQDAAAQNLLSSYQSILLALMQMINTITILQN